MPEVRHLLWWLTWGRRLPPHADEGRTGLYHFEGRSWRGFHHHAALAMLSFGFLVLEQRRAKTKVASKKSLPPHLV